MFESARVTKTGDVVIQGTFHLRGALHRRSAATQRRVRLEPRGAAGQAPLAPAGQGQPPRELAVPAAR